MHGPTCVIWANLTPCSLQLDTGPLLFPDLSVDFEDLVEHVQVRCIWSYRGHF
jgi:hypothetical protein